MAIPSPQELDHALVLGAGQMGAGIAQVLLAADIGVTLFDIDATQRDRAARSITAGLEKMTAKGLIEGPAALRIAKLVLADDLDALPAAPFAIEAVVEDESVKLDLLRRIAARLPADAVLASNTSSISITRMGRLCGRPENFVGVHFMNPAPLMKLVEVVVGVETAAETVTWAEGLVERLGKTHVRSSDYPGFLVNRILLPMINEAVYALQDSVGTAEDIDTAMVQGTNQPMGPLALADLIGLDTCLAILEVMHKTFGDDKYRPAPLLRRMVDAGRLGRKASRGFYDYAAR